MGFSEVPRGIPPSYAAARQALPAAIARDLCLTGRTLDAREALELGVVSEVHIPGRILPRAREIAGRIAELPRSGVEQTKRRILLEQDEVWGPLIREEEQALRDALLR